MVHRFFPSRRHANLFNLSAWAGFAFILLGIGCGVAALVIGLVSDGLAQDAWTVSTSVVQPSVLLSVTATLANAFLRAAFTEGAVIAWWVQAHQGASVGTLQALYNHADSFWWLFQSPTKLSKVKIAALATLLLLLDGPFLQRASSVQITFSVETTKLSIPVSPHPLVSGATAYITDRSNQPALYTENFATIAQGYNRREPIYIPGLRSLESLTTELIAPGFDVSCRNDSSSYRIMSSNEYVELQNCKLKDAKQCPQTCNDTSPRDKQCQPTDTITGFNITMGFGYETFPQRGDDPQYQFAINVLTLHKSTPGENGTLVRRDCTLREAIVRYPVKIQNGTVSLQAMALSENRTQHLVRRNNEVYFLGQNALGSTVGGLFLALKDQYQTNARIQIDPPSYSIKYENPVGNQFFVGGAGEVRSINAKWFDPVDTIVASAHELALRTAVNITATLNNTSPQRAVLYPDLRSVNRALSQEVTGTISTNGPHYITNLGWLIGGFAMILLAGIAVAPLYWAWWRLERALTLNPLEVSRAFDAPLLRSANSDTPPDNWSQEMKSLNIRYGKGAETEEELLSGTKEMNASQTASAPEAGIYKFRKVE